MICSHTGHTCTWPPHVWIACVFPVSLSRLPCGQIGHNQREFFRVFIVYESSVSSCMLFCRHTGHKYTSYHHVLTVCESWLVAFVLLCSHIDHKHYSFSVSTFEVFHQMLFLLMKWLFQLLICDHIDHNHNWMTNVLPIQAPFRCCLIVALIAVIINSNQHQIVSPGGVILELLFYPAFSLVKKQEKVKRTNTFLF